MQTCKGTRQSVNIVTVNVTISTGESILSKLLSAILARITK